MLIPKTKATRLMSHRVLYGETGSSCGLQQFHLHPLFGLHRNSYEVMNLLLVIKTGGLVRLCALGQFKLLARSSSMGCQNRGCRWN